MNLYEILQNPYRVGEGMTHFERLFAQKLGGERINEMSGVPPLRYIGYGRPLTDYLISGNTLQDGTPSPDMPVDVVGCGVRNAQLYFKAMVGCSIGTDGRIIKNTSFDCYVAKVEANQHCIGTGYVYAFYASEPALGSVSYNGQRVIEPAADGFTSPIDGYVAVRHDVGLTDAMLNLGSTALPYEPYGFKLPLTVNGTEYPIYLGTVPTTRRIKKLVLTGEEVTWGNYVNGRARFIVSPRSILYSTVSGLVISDRYNNTYTVSQLNNNSVENAIASYDGRIYIYTNEEYDIDTYKSYLAAQYANGTPVTIWYVLAQPETGIVNEPLHKIGDYADTISMTQAGVTIPTVTGINTLTIPTEVPPSEVWIRGNIKEV